MAKKNSTVEEDSAVQQGETEAAAVETPVVEPAAAEAPAAEPAPVAERAADRSEAAEPADVPETDPARGLGLIAVVVSIVLAPVGFVIGLIAYRRSRAAEFGGGFGMAAMIIGGVATALIAVYFFMLATGMGFGGACDGLETGIHRLDNGQTVSCR